MLNLCEILKGCEGISLYSNICGICTLEDIRIKEIFSICVSFTNKHGFKDFCSFTKEGKWSENADKGECLLFPSKSQRDWSKFIKPREDLEIGTHVLCFNDLSLRTSVAYPRIYTHDGNCKSVYRINSEHTWKHIVPIDKFNFENLTFNLEDDYGTDSEYLKK